MLIHKIERLHRLQQKLGKWWWWIWPNMQLSDAPVLGRFFTRLASLPLGPYRKKWPLASVKPYISPKAQVAGLGLNLDRGCFIDDFVTLYSAGVDGTIRLGRNVYVYRGTIIEAGQGGQVTIGSSTHIQAYCTLCGYVRNIKIGSHVMIAPHCDLLSYPHKTVDLHRHVSEGELDSEGDLVIEDDVWLGMGAKVMGRVRIGRGAIIGAGAVVAHDIPPYSIAVGVPAQVTRWRSPTKPAISTEGSPQGG
jgi:acetyltransferase-like isoleucine patch superfamily enzyme